MNGRVCLVTGGNTGIGKATAAGLARAGATVILACRDLRKAEAVVAAIDAEVGPGKARAMPLDLASLASIRAFAEGFRGAFDRLDVLVNNAGVWTRTRSTTADGFELTFGVNHLGHFLLTRELEELLAKSAPSRVVVLSSALHRRGRLVWDDLMYERRAFRGPEAYAQSKLANLLFARTLARRLAGRGVTANAVHPGVVATELAREYPAPLMRLANLFLLTPEKGAATSLHVATAPELASVTGAYFEKCREVRPARAALDDTAGDRLWQESEALLARAARVAA